MIQDLDGFTERDMLIEILTKMEEMKESITTLSKEVHGNGQPGIKDRLAKVEEAVATHKKLVFGALGIALASIPGGEIITKFLENLPQTP